MLKKSKKDAVITGVCGGIGETLHINPNYIRAGVAISAFFSFGITTVVYAVAAITMKKD